MAESTVPTTTNQSAEGALEVQATREPDRYLVPPVDIYETEEGLTVLVDLPGVDQKGVDVRVDNGVLTIRGRSENRVSGDELINEFNLLDYFRQFQLSERVDQGKIAAEFRHGVLRVNLPKAESAKPRQIAVQMG